MDKQNKVSIHTTTVTATAVECDNGKMKVLKGSTMKAYGVKDMAKAKATYQKLLKNGVLHVEDSLVTFTKDSEFANANEAASFLLHRGGDNTKAWKQKKTATTHKKVEKVLPKKKATPKKEVVKKNIETKKPSTKKVATKAPTTKTPTKKPTHAKSPQGKNAKRGNPRNPRGIKPQGMAAVQAAQEVQNTGFVRFAGMQSSISNKKH